MSEDGVIPENYSKECADKDVYYDYFTNKNMAIKFCDDTKQA